MFSKVDVNGEDAHPLFIDPLRMVKDIEYLLKLQDFYFIVLLIFSRSQNLSVVLFVISER
jgi:hypothetical protein